MRTISLAPRKSRYELPSKNLCYCRPKASLWQKTAHDNGYGHTKQSIKQTGLTSIFPLRIDAACSSLADKSNSIKAGARGPTDTSGGTGRLAMSSSKRST